MTTGYLHETWSKETPNDAHVYADDLTVKTTHAAEIYPKLNILPRRSQIFRIFINWTKTKIIVDGGIMRYKQCENNSLINIKKYSM